MDEYPSFLEYLRMAIGTRNWCIAPRVSKRTAHYDVVLTPKRFAELQNAWAAQHPAWLLARTLPEGDAKRFILKAVQSRLNKEA